MLPSLSEGFGLPVVEAMACGTPVACSKRGALPEVASHAAVYFDPFDTGAMAATLRRLLENPGYRRMLAERGKARAQLRALGALRRHRWPRNRRY